MVLIDIRKEKDRGLGKGVVDLGGVGGGANITKIDGAKFWRN